MEILGNELERLVGDFRDRFLASAFQDHCHDYSPRKSFKSRKTTIEKFGKSCVSHFSSVLFQDHRVLLVDAFIIFFTCQTILGLLKNKMSMFQMAKQTTNLGFMGNPTGASRPGLRTSRCNEAPTSGPKPCVDPKSLQVFFEDDGKYYLIFGPKVFLYEQKEQETSSNSWSLWYSVFCRFRYSMLNTVVSSILGMKPYLTVLLTVLSWYGNCTKVEHRRHLLDLPPTATCGGWEIEIPRQESFLVNHLLLLLFLYLLPFPNTFQSVFFRWASLQGSIGVWCFIWCTLNSGNGCWNCLGYCQPLDVGWRLLGVSCCIPTTAWLNQVFPCQVINRQIGPRSTKLKSIHHDSF